MFVDTIASKYESTEVQTLGAVYTTREERRPAIALRARMDVTCITHVRDMSERGSLLRKRRRLEYLVAYLC